LTLSDGIWLYRTLICCRGIVSACILSRGPGIFPLQPCINSGCKLMLVGLCVQTPGIDVAPEANTTRNWAKKAGGPAACCSSRNGPWV
jgi:hypothetical protein